MPRRVLAMVCVAASAALLAACASAPTTDLDAARDWVEGVQRANQGDPSIVGAATMIVGIPEDVEEDDEEPLGTTLEFDDPIRFDAARVSCSGGITVTFVVEVSAGTTSWSTGDDILCDEEPHELAPAGETGGVQSVRLDATGPAQTYLYAAIIGAQE